MNGHIVVTDSAGNVVLDTEGITMIEFNAMPNEDYALSRHSGSATVTFPLTDALMELFHLKLPSRWQRFKNWLRR